ncbi:MAG: hypothetical protein UT48_C0014G0005 [Parcubacteria group bacterium GW2011_GWE2_39_37]|nr:MAG: hypothetical protein UT48_C0014G0005 [Parcubacteria group bacterium GW2011_GWE2_39_37]
MEFFTKYKKILLVIGFILIVFILGYLLYALFFKSLAPSDPQVNPIATTTPSGGLPKSSEGGEKNTASTEGGALTDPGQKAGPEPSEKANGGVTKTYDLTKTESIGATLDGNGSQIQYYDKEAGKFFRIDNDGNVTELSDKIFHQVKNVVWSPNKNKAILEYPDGAKIIYDFSSNKQITLPSHWKDFSFSPTGDKIVMKSMGEDPNNRWLAIVSEDGSKAMGVEELGDKDSTVYPMWSPNNQMVAMFTEGKDFDRQEVYFVGLNKENFKSTIVEGRGFVPKWAPTGDRLLYSVYSTQNELKPSLWIVDAEGDNIGNNRKRLNIETWADKCSFADPKTLYCAVPQKLEEGSGLFPELAKNTIDDLYRIDTQTGSKKKIAIPENNLTISNLIPSKDGRYLYFNDQASGRLHKINLK